MFNITIMEPLKHEAKLIAILKRDKIQRNHFFTYSKKPDYFLTLVKHGFFNINNYPIENTRHGSKDWTQLVYLHNIISSDFRLNNPGHCEYVISNVLRAIIESKHDSLWVDNMITKMLALLYDENVDLPTLDRHLTNLQSRYPNGIIQNEEVTKILFPAILNQGNTAKIELMIVKMFNLNEEEKTIFGSSLTKAYIKVIKTIYSAILKVKNS